MITADILQSWYSENAIRRFPLSAEATGVDTNGKALPDSFLVGMEVMVPSTMSDITEEGFEEPTYVPYLSKVVINNYEVSVTVAAAGKDVAVATVSVSDIEDIHTTKGVALASLAVDDTAFEGVSGRLFFGPVSGFLDHGGTYTFSSPSQTGISLDCVHSYPECVRSLNINGTRVTGDVTLVGGDNIDISYDAEADTVTISFIPDTVEGIYDVNELIDAIATRYGEPITTINNIPADEEGNFALEPVPGGCLSVEVQDHGLTLSNPCASPCCDKGVLERLMDDIQALNARYARIYSYLTEAASNVNTLQNELSILKMSMK